jgi:CcmD family protein
MLFKLNLVYLLLLLAQSLFAQGNVEMADALYSSGKIYIVVAVLMIIFIGIVIYLIQTDRKISALEKEWKNKSNKQ